MISKRSAALFLDLEAQSVADQSETETEGNSGDESVKGI